MDLSLKEAAQLMGKSQRQVRYMLQQGRLKAKKEGGRWLVARESLPLSDAQVARGLLEQSRLKEVVESALGAPAGASAGKRLYSVTDLKAFNIGKEVLASLRESLGEDAPVALRMTEALGLLTCGCHTFHKRDKVAHFARAREKICYALCALLLSPKEDVRSLAAPIEAELLPALGGLIRGTERRR